MTIYCCRCPETASTEMAYDYDQREVWLDDIGGELGESTVYRLCSGHSARLSPPVGWVLFDLRRPALELFPSRDVA